ncbi:putative nuclease HARBI1 [Ixodes scapularis]|uniref:putative nuclease HARBI1 n=1 Tax=Ixodes scapularis TaxID=6945 RepID=UPI001A9EBCCA|nr:putative nuclease HARBI1 [Ixodes scapularis]
MSNARNRRHRRDRTDAQYAAAMMRRQRVLRDRLNPFEDFDEDGLQQRFRFGRAGIMFLADTLRPDLERRTRRSRALSAEQQVIIALQFYATGNFLITAGDYIRVHVSSASRAVRQVTVALARRAQDFIRWPDAAEGAALQHKFYDMAGFPLVVGAVDGTHVRIQAPHVHEEAYVNRHGYHSINVQVVVDASSRIRNVVARWPGSTHDSRIFTESTLAVKLASGEYDGLLLGDSGYSCQPWLMTPFLSPSSAAEVAYNTAHTTTRSIVERTIGQLKRRFHCLHAELRMAPERCCDIIVACCALHSLAKRYPCRTPVAAIPAEVPVEPVAANRAESNEARDFIVNHFFG